MNTKKLILLTSFCILVLSAVYFSNFSIVKFLYSHKPKNSPLNVSREEFLNSYTSLNTDWMEQRIVQDLSLHKCKGISQKACERLLKNPKYGLARVTIENHSVDIYTKFSSPRIDAMKQGFELLCQLVTVPNVTFYLSVADVLPENIQAPIFVFAKHENNKGQVLIPDFSLFATKDALYAYHSHIAPEILKASKKVPWKRKNKTLMWRGATTGIDFDKQNWKNSARIKVCDLSKTLTFLDAKISHISQVPKERLKEVKDAVSIGNFITPAKHLQYRYLLCLDGNTCTYPGLHWRLLSNSVVFKQETKDIQWFYGALKPYVHYVPVKSDLSDLAKQYNHAINNDVLMKQIAENSTKFAENYLSLGGVYTYLTLLFEQYAQLKWLDE